MNSRVRGVLLIAVSVLFVVTSSAWLAQPPLALPRTDPGCSCLEYFERTQGLPVLGQYAYEYPDLLSKSGYTVSYLNPWLIRDRGYLAWQLNGAGIVIDPGKHGAYSPAGHIGVMVGAAYNWNTMRWRFNFRDANAMGAWEVFQPVPLPDSGCYNVTIHSLVTDNLDGIRFFTWMKK